MGLEPVRVLGAGVDDVCGVRVRCVDGAARIWNAVASARLVYCIDCRHGLERGAISSRPGGEDEGGFGRPFFSTEVRYILTAADFRLEQLRCLQVP